MEIIEAYKILGVDNNSSEKDVKSAYRKLVLKYHPDKNKELGSEEKFKEISMAYDTILNGMKYKEPSFDWNSYGDNSFSSIFDEYFSNRNPIKRYNLHIPINLEDVFNGVVKHITIDGNDIKISIPVGVKNNHKLKYTQKIENSTYVIYITVEILPNENFIIDAFDLYTIANVIVYDCILGGDVEILLPNKERIKININKETQNGKVLRAKGKGLPVYDGFGLRGDLYIKINAVLPEKLNTQEYSLYEELKKINENK